MSPVMLKSIYLILECLILAVFTRRLTGEISQLLSVCLTFRRSTFSLCSLQTDPCEPQEDAEHGIKKS